MMISVSERTREIGVRKALGATRWTILWQFLVEAVTLTGIGASVGLVLDNVIHDSTEFQFLGSELYRKDCTLDELGTAFSKRERRRYRRLAQRLNAEQRGDQAAFYFRKPA